MKFDAVYYEPAIFDYPLGRQLREEYGDLPWIPIESHNSIREMQEKPNDQFGHMKRNLIAGIRKTHKYVENHKVSDYLVPYTSSGCTAMCLYCYLVCNYNKCAYLRLFVNREQMLDRIIKKGKNSGTPLTFEIGSNSDLVLENTITGNLLYTIPGYPCGLLIAPVILVEGWKEMYTGLLEELRDGLSDKMKSQMFLEIILMTYSYVHRAINSEAFPNAPDLYDREQMTGRGRGRYCYRAESREEAQLYLRQEIGRVLGNVPILYIS